MTATRTSLRRPASYADLEALPEHVIGEIIDGELVVSPRPAALHAFAAYELSGELRGPFRLGRGGPGGWWILAEPELHLEADVLVPDLAGWRVERMHMLADVPHFELAPDWICEILSPSTGVYDRRDKLRIYARERIPRVWLIDPRNRTLEVLRLEGTQWMLELASGGDDKVRAQPFDAIELDLSVLWLPAAAPSEAR